jgi:DNA-binding NarL/FixJ family response regulator
MRVLIVTESPLAAEALRHVLRHAPNSRVIGYVNARGACGPAVADLAPDVVVFDEMASQAHTLTRIREIRGAAPQAKLMLLTANMDADWLANAAASGVDAAVSRTASPAAVGVLVREVAAGNVFHTFASAAPTAKKPTPIPVDLTARELEILRLVAAGSSNSRIAGELYVTEQTVKFHLSNVYRKLGAANRTQASHIAHTHGLLDTSPQPVPYRNVAALPLAA